MAHPRILVPSQVVLAGASSAPPLVLPQVASATLLLDLRASQLALSEGNPVSTWVDKSGLTHDFTAGGAARPTYRAGGGVPYVESDGIGNWMLGPNIADSLPNFATFMVWHFEAGVWLAPGLNKIGNYACSDPGSNGWHVDGTQMQLLDDTLDQTEQTVSTPPSNGKHISTGEVRNRKTYTFLDGAVSEFYPPGGLVLGAGALSYSTSEPLRLFTDGLGAIGDGSCNGYDKARIFSVLLYQINDLIAWNATDRAAINAWLATNP